MCASVLLDEKHGGQGTSKGIPSSDQLSRWWGRDKKPALGGYLLSAKCFLNTVQYTGKDKAQAPWGSYLNRTDEVRHNWLNSYPVLMTSLWEPKASSVVTGAIHQTLTSGLCPLRSWHRGSHQEGGCVFVWSASHSASLPRHSRHWPIGSRGKSIVGFCGWSRKNQENP